MTRAVWIGAALAVCAGVALAFGLTDRAQPEEAVSQAHVDTEVTQVSLSQPDAEDVGTTTVPAAGADAPGLPSPLVSYEERLGRPIVFFAEGTLGPNLLKTLGDLDEDVRAFDYDAQPQSMAEIDVYLLKARSFEDMRGRTNHILHSRIISELDGKPDSLPFAWFSVGITKNGEDETRDVIVLLVNDVGVSRTPEFCVSLFIYEMIRFVHDTPAYQAALAAGGLMSNQCERDGWQSVEDMRQRG